MKTRTLKLLLVAMCLFAFISKIDAQNTEEDILKKGYISDAIINIVIDHLPVGWKFKDENGFFIFQRTDSIWQLMENTLNVPLEKKEDRFKRIQANGRKTVAKIVIRYEKKWDFLKVQEVSLANMEVYNKIRLLPGKYKITGLKDLKLSSKGNTVYTPITEDDKKRIANYYAERLVLEGKIVGSPDLSSQLYSLFVVEKSGCNDENHLVYPDAASVELYSILTLCREICGK
ncbi:MAG: hypothetical protein WCQ95_02785 [Bacteroidota bacterium]